MYLNIIFLYFGVVCIFWHALYLPKFIRRMLRFVQKHLRILFTCCGIYSTHCVCVVYITVFTYYSAPSEKSCLHLLLLLLLPFFLFKENLLKVNLSVSKSDKIFSIRNMFACAKIWKYLCAIKSCVFLASLMDIWSWRHKTFSFSFTIHFLTRKKTIRGTTVA